jgi:raffinose/stachyose/melibiose transport system substrate-binding protein
MWTWAGAPGKAALTISINSYEKLHPNVKIVDTELASDAFKAKVPLALNSGKSIDILAVQPNLFASQVQSQLLPLSQWQGDLPPGTMSKFTALSLEQSKKLFTGGQVYSVPMAVSGSAVCYDNVDLLNSVGASVPKTWADMATLGKLLAQKKPGVATMVMPSGSDSWFLDEFVLTLAGQQDANFFNNVRYNKGKWDTPSYVSALTAYQNFFKTGALSKNVTDLDYNDAMTAFYSGKAAIVCNGTWASSMLSESFRAANKINIKNIGVLPVPAIGDPSTRSLRSFLDVTMGIPKSSKNVKAAADFIGYLTAGDGVNGWASQLGEIPAVNGWQAPAGTMATPEEQAGFTEIENLIAHPHSDRNNLSAFSAAVGARILDVINGADPADTAKKMQDDLDSGKYS